MKFKFSLQKKEIDVEADVEGLVEKGFQHKEKQPPKKTRYQIKQEEKRKTEELKFKQCLIYIGIMVGIVLVFVIIAIIATILGI